MKTGGKSDLEIANEGIYAPEVFIREMGSGGASNSPRSPLHGQKPSMPVFASASIPHNPKEFQWHAY